MATPTPTSYHPLIKLLHWLSAITVFGLFALGFWMVELTYYSAWYKTAPYWHKSVGIILFVVTLIRLAAKRYYKSPPPLTSHSATVKLVTQIGHLVIYIMLLVLMISGYLISTADDRPISVFNIIDVPALGELFANQADIAGFIHQYLAYALVAFSILHGIAALKHHFIDQDDTLNRMIK